MKKTILMMIVLCISIISSTAQNKNDKKGEKETVVFDVSMTCNSCKKRIEKNIPFEKGVKDLQVNLDEKTVMIVYQNNKTNEDKLREAIEKMGYTVSIHQDNKEE